MVCDNLLLVHMKQDFNVAFTEADFKAFVDDTDSATTWTKAEMYDLETELLNNLPDLSGHNVLRREEMNHVLKNVLSECVSRQLEAQSDDIFVVNEKIKKDNEIVISEADMKKKIRRLNCSEAAEKRKGECETKKRRLNCAEAAEKRRKTAADKNDPFNSQEDKWMAELMTENSAERAAEEVEREEEEVEDKEDKEEDVEEDKEEDKEEDVEEDMEKDGGAVDNKWMGQQGENDLELEDELREKHAMAELERE